MSAVQDYILQLKGNQHAICSYLNDWFINEFNLQDKIRFKIPFYFQHSWVCYTNPIKNEGIELVFLRGQELSNEQGLLESKDRKMVAGFSIYKLEDLTSSSIHEVIHEAILLDEMVAKNKEK